MSTNTSQPQTPTIDPTHSINNNNETEEAQPVLQQSANQKQQQQQTLVSVFHPRASVVRASAGRAGLEARAVNGGDVVLFDSSVPNTLCVSVGEEFSDFHYPHAATHVRFSRCDRYVATCGEDGKIGLWDRLRSKRFTLLGHRGAVYRVIFNEKSSLIASCGEDGTAIVWDLLAGSSSRAGIGAGNSSSSGGSSSTRAVGDKKMVLRGHAGKVLSVAICGTTIATGSEDQTVVLWDATTGQHVSVMKGHSGVVFCVMFSPSILLPTRVLASAGEDGKVNIWDCAEAVATCNSNNNTSSNNNSSVSQHEKNYARNHQHRRGTHERTESSASSSSTSEMPLSPIGANNSNNNNSSFTNNNNTSSQQQTSAGAAAGKKEVAPPKIKAVLYGHQGCVFSLAFSRDGRYLATSGEDKIILIWHCTTWQRVASLSQQGHTDAVTSVAFSPLNSNLLASGSDDSFVLVWDVKTQTRLQILEAEAGVVNCVHWSPNGDVLGTAHEDGSVLLWDISPGKLQATLQAHEDEVKAMCFSPNKKFFATGGVDQKIFIWDLTTWTQSACLDKHVGPISCLSFSPDGSLLASASEDTTVVLWEVYALNEKQQLEPCWTKKFTFRHHDSPIVRIIFEAAPLDDSNDDKNKNNNHNSNTDSPASLNVHNNNNPHSNVFGSSQQKHALRVVDSLGVASLWNIYSGELIRVVQDVNDDLLHDGDSFVSSPSQLNKNKKSSTPTNNMGSPARSLVNNNNNKILPQQQHVDPLNSNNDHNQAASAPLASELSPQEIFMEQSRKLDHDWDRGRRSYIDEEKTSRMFLMESRVHDSARIANFIMKHKQALDQKDFVRDQICSRVILCEKQESFDRSALDKQNQKLESELEVLKIHSHQLERTLAALTGSAKKTQLKNQAAGISCGVQTFYSMTRDADVAWLWVTPEEPFRFAPDSVCFRVYLEDTRKNDQNEDGSGDNFNGDSSSPGAGQDSFANSTSGPNSSNAFVANLSFTDDDSLLQQQQSRIDKTLRKNLIAAAATAATNNNNNNNNNLPSTNKNTDSKPSSPLSPTSPLLPPKILLVGSLQSATGIASATECFCSVELPKFLRDRFARGGLAGRPMHGVSYKSFDALRLNPIYIQHLGHWLSYVQNANGSSFAPEKRMYQIEASNAVFAATKSMWLLQHVKRQHFALPMRKPINWVTAFAPCSKNILFDLAGTSSTFSILNAVGSEHGKAFKSLFEQHTILSRSNNALANDQTSLSSSSSSLMGSPSHISSLITCQHSSIILSPSLERAAARSVALTNAIHAGSRNERMKQLPPSPWVNFAGRGDMVPVLLCSIAITGMLPASPVNESEQSHFNKTVFDPFLHLFSAQHAGPNLAGAPSIQNGSSTVLLAATRRANFDRVFNDTGNFDYLEFIVPRGGMVVPMGIVWVSVSDDFREDALGFAPKLL